MTKIYTNKYIQQLDVEQNLTDLLKDIQAIVKVHGETTYATFEAEQYDDQYEVYVYARVLETDEEYEERLAVEARGKLCVAREELETLARLQAKYPGR